MLRAALLSLVGLTTMYCRSQSHHIDVTNYTFNLHLSDENDSIQGHAVISFVAQDTVSLVEIDLAGIKKDKKGMIVDDVLQLPGNTGKLRYYQTAEKLFVDLGRPLQKNESAKIEILYRGIPSDGLIISRNRYGNRTFFADNWPNRAHNWIPCVDDPADKAPVEFIVDAPSRYEVVANGLLVRKSALPGNRQQTHWKETVPLPTKIMVIGVTKFAVKEEGTTHGIPVSTWVYPENKEKGFYDYALAKEILGFLIEYIGPFPYKKLANVQSLTIFGGMENANTIFYNETYVNGRQDQYTLIAHEITHQWFGDMATEKSFAHLWLSEGFATYLAILYMQHRFGADTAVAMLQEDRDQVIKFVKTFNRPVVDSVSPVMDLLNANSYQKGGWVLHMLRMQLGDTLFQKCIRSYYERFAGKNAETLDLQKVFEDVSGKDLSAFFRQWLYMPGIPELSVQWRHAGGKLEITVRQLQKNSYQFPLELGVQFGTGVAGRTETLAINQAVQTFTIPTPEKPSSLVIDPATKLLFSGTIAEKR